MNKKIITGFLMFALAVFSMSSFVACKDYDEDSYDDLKARINKQITLTDAIQNQIAELEKKLNNIKSCTCDPSKYASQEEFEKALKRIADLEEAIKNIKSCTCEGGGGGDTTIYITNPYDD
jgi:peptidoglycan hydrolase CwlO-like protein